MSSEIKDDLKEKISKQAEKNPDNLNEDNYDSNNEDYDEEDCNYDDDHNNNYICESEEEIEEDENDLYLNDPEYFEHECYPINKIDWILEQKCQKLMQNLKLDDPWDALYLLKQFKWNHSKIIELYTKDKASFLSLYFSDDNNNNSKKTIVSEKTRLISYLNIYNENLPLFQKIKNSSSSPSQKTIENYCSICCCTKTNPDNDMLALDECSHFFCTDCWRMHFESLIQNGASHVYECMQTKCNVIASKEFVLKCINSGLSTKNLAEKYKKLVALNLIKESEDLQYCPGEEVITVRASSTSAVPVTTGSSTPKSQTSAFRLISTVTSTPTVSFTFRTASPVAPSSMPAPETITKKCNNIIWIKSKPAARRVLCSTCNTQFCFLCSSPYHAPNACSTIRKWNIKCQDDSETRNYLLVHTQDCPKCKVCIEKNGGCSHMTCNRCKHEFCWGKMSFS